ncbi:MAG: helix-turn-helix domain-containing protein [Acetobacteraceae bacterium]|nr:helix-turn-helix domain-containing protein [Acetobacteraceae bacterium]
MGEVGRLLRAERARRGLNQTDLGALLGLTRQKVQLIEAGQPGVAADTVLRALADLGVLVLAVPPNAGPALDAARRLADAGEIGW